MHAESGKVILLDAMEKSNSVDLSNWVWVSCLV